MYTVMIGDDGMFSAEYVVPPALSIPLGTSGSAVDVVRNEDGTFSADGEVITAETMVTAENGNVYAAVLSPEGVPVGVMHVAAMQDVMLGELGGTVKLTQAEDMSWWLGETAVADGSVHTHENGNMYTLMMDAEGMWSAMYKKVEVIVQLGTQDPITLERAEDMSWWLGSEAVDVASEVMSDNGNTYTLWYTDGVWSARFEPESMMIEGTGLVAMTREGDDMYDVGDSTLEATGMGDVMDGDAMYHVWMQDDALMGARFDAAIDTDTDHNTATLRELPFLSANDADTPGNELRTHLVATGSNTDGRGMFSMGALLGSGMASDESMSFVNEAVEEIEDVRAYVSAVLALDDPLDGLPDILDDQWANLNKALDDIFGTDSDNPVDDEKDFAIARTSAPPEEDILDEIDDILAALSSESSFVAATAEDGGGVFAGQELGSGAASDAFNRVRWSADATLGMTGSTRYGTVVRKVSVNAKTKSSIAANDYGAFSYSTMEQTVRTADAAAVSLTGIARYSGRTRAVSGTGKAYSGMMDLEVRFRANEVTGVVTGLEDADGLPWQHNFADVSQIVLGDATLRRNATWDTSGNTSKTTGTVFYTRDSGILRPFSSLTNTFKGILLGQGANAGSEANGVWSVGTQGTTANYLAGGFGVVHVADATRPTPSGDDGSGAEAKLFSTLQGADANENNASATIADGMLTVKTRSYGWTDGNDGKEYLPLTDDMDTQDVDDDEAVLTTAKIDLAALAASGTSTVNGPTWVNGIIAALERERGLLSTLQGLESVNTEEAEMASWQRVKDAVQHNLFNGLLPEKLGDTYANAKSDAIDLIDRVLDALSSNDKLEAALDPKGTGIFNQYWIDDGNGTVEDGETHDFRYYDETDRRYEVVNDNDPATAPSTVGSTRNGRTAGQIRSQQEYKVIAAMGTTDFTRFGFWRREGFRSARRDGKGETIGTQGGPGTFAYSSLDPTHVGAIVGTTKNLSFPTNGRATYTGETIAQQGANTTLTGTARVDVEWVDPANLAANTTTIGTMQLTISDLATAAGDPLSQGGSGTDNSDNTGNEIADIVFPGLEIIVGGRGDYEDNMIVGAPSSPADDTEDFTYGEVAVANARYRRAAAGSDINATGTQTAKALFVGRGVDGPLGVIGTWTLDDDTVGRIAPDGDHVDDYGAPIYGAFGAQVP